MSKLDELKRVGFTNDVEVMTSVESYVWDVDKVQDEIVKSTSRLSLSKCNVSNLIAMINMSTYRVPFLGFVRWLVLYKKISCNDNINAILLDTCFNEYVLYYLYSLANKNLTSNVTEFKLNEYFYKELSKYTKAKNKINIIDLSIPVSIGDVTEVKVEHLASKVRHMNTEYLGIGS